MERENRKIVRTTTWSAGPGCHGGCGVLAHITSAWVRALASSIAAHRRSKLARSILQMFPMLAAHSWDLLLNWDKTCPLGQNRLETL